jgi:adenylate kinase
LIDGGSFVPDDLTIQLFKQTLDDYVREGRYTPSEQTLILDGIPRNSAQVDLIDPIVNVKKIIYLFSDEATLIKRLTTVRAKEEGRDDDKNEETIRKRLETYEKETKEVLDRYNPSLIERVESKGVGTMKEIDKEIKRRIANW